MGRTAGATAADTRERLLRVAADVFGRRGYEGTRVADVSAAAGLSNGAMYAYFGSRAELLVAALRTHGRRLLAELVSADPGRSVTELLLVSGRSLRGRRAPADDLVVEALIAARRDADVAGPMRDYVRERAGWLAGLVRRAQAAGELDPALPADAVAYFCLALSAGTALVGPGLDDVDDEAWAALLARLVAALAARPITTTAQTGSRP
jgi:AcrR family transcriptional regulator